MPPKKKEAKPPPEEPAPDEQIAEEEEEGPGRAAFVLSCEGVSNLPCPLETLLQFGGVCRPNRSAPAAASSAPSGWELKKHKFIRTCGQQLYDDLVDKDLTVRLRDAKEDEVIGQASVSLQPLLHDALEVGGEVELKLTAEYQRKWFEDPADVEAAKTKTKGKKSDTKAPPAPQPEVSAVTSAPAVPPPATTIRLFVRVQELVAPAEDRDDWTTLTLGIRGIFALPERLSGLALANPNDVELHPLRYRAALLGEALGEGVLSKPVKRRPEESEQHVDVELTHEEWQAEREQFDVSIQFKGAEKFRRYRGPSFARDFQRMLNHVGGVWFYLLPEEKPPMDAKKGNLPDVAGPAAFYRAKAWLDLRTLIRRGVNSVEARCPLVAADPSATSHCDLPTFESSKAFVHLVLELSRDLKPPEHPSLQVDLDSLLPQQTEPINKFPDSRIAEQMYWEALERAVDVMSKDCAGKPGKKGAQDIISIMKRSGSYEAVKEHLRRTVISVTRERLRKDTSIVPGKPMEPDARKDFMASTYAYLSGTMGHVLDDLRAKNPLPEKPEPPAYPPPVEPTASIQTLPSLQPTPGASFLHNTLVSNVHESTDTLGSSRRGIVQEPARTSARSPHGFSSPEGDVTPTDSRDVSAVRSPVVPTATVPPADPLAHAVALGPAASRSWQALSVARDKGERYKRLAFEAEMVGRYDRAAEMMQNRLLLDEFGDDPQEWVAYAKICARAGGRQAAAEEALRQAVQLMAGGSTSPFCKESETAMEVDLMLSCLLLDRGCYEEAVKVLTVWHEKDLADPWRSFLLGLGLFLAGEGESARPVLEAVAKPPEWFADVQDDEGVATKLRDAAPEAMDPKPYAECLERLLEFGLPSLAFTFIDQCDTLSQEELAREPMALMDARASAMERDFSASVARVERLVASGSASREAWRLAGECYLQMGEMDKCVKAFETALSFEEEFDDPAVFLQLGTAFLAKEQWKQASTMLLRSVQCKATAEAWSGVAYAEYRVGELTACYEALCEAALLDNARADVWAMLALVHLRQENLETAESCLLQCLGQSPDCEELLVEVAAECNKSGRKPSLAEATARKALELRDSGPARQALVAALASQGDLLAAIRETEHAVGSSAVHADLRKSLLDRALRWCEELGDDELAKSLIKAEEEAAAADVLHLRPLSP